MVARDHEAWRILLFPFFVSVAPLGPAETENGKEAERDKNEQIRTSIALILIL